jgi:putative ABC transport system permease protein
MALSFRHTVLDSLRMALQVPVRNPGRSALTTLGLAIGVGAFIAMVSFGRGARSSVVSQFETLGSNLLRLKAYYGATSEAPRLLVASDVDALRRESTTLEHVVPVVTGSLDVSYRGKRVRTNVRGTTPQFVHTGDWSVSSGGLFDAADLQQKAKVCVLGSGTARQLFGSSADPLGQVVTIGNNLPCRVIGVLSARGAAISGGDLDERLVMPLSTYETHLGTPTGYFQIEIRPKSRELLEAARNEVTQIMRRRHDIEPGAPDDFHIISPDDVTLVAEQIGGILTALLAGIAAVSLLVGGIGIMNIQLVSVAERTHEIGIRAAIGASPEQIMRQFLAEAVVLAALGALAGVALGLGAAVLVAKQMHWPQATSADVVIGSALFGIAVGVVFGYIPAKRAADLDPIEALRRE